MKQYTIEERDEEVIRRARCVLGHREGVEPETRPICTASLRYNYKLELSNDDLAFMACRVATDTLFWDGY